MCGIGRASAGPVRVIVLAVANPELLARSLRALREMLCVLADALADNDRRHRERDTQLLSQAQQRTQCRTCEERVVEKLVRVEDDEHYGNRSRAARSRTANARLRGSTRED